MSDLLPCPFCGGQLEQRHDGWFDHPRGKCILSEKVFPAFHRGWLGQWNTRADLPSPQDAARIAELEAEVAALRKVEQAARALNVRKLVAGWNGEGRETPYTPHAPELWAKITTTCGAVYALDAALKGEAP